MSLLFHPDVWAIATVWAESRGESWDGKRAVAEVIRNRTEQHYSSDGTVAGTCLRAYQFSCWLPNDPNLLGITKLRRNDHVVAECASAWREASLRSTPDVLPATALLYHATTMVTPPKWAAPEVATRLLTIGRHVFYKPRLPRSGTGGGGGEDAEQREATPAATPAAKPREA